jgi:hypothetical protein
MRRCEALELAQREGAKLASLPDARRAHHVHAALVPLIGEQLPLTPFHCGLELVTTDKLAWADGTPVANMDSQILAPALSAGRRIVGYQHSNTIIMPEDARLLPLLEWPEQST